MEEEHNVKAVSPSLKTEFTPRGSRFTKGDFIHIQFDGGSQSGVGTGGFLITNRNGTKLVRAGSYYG
jgi:hypothetical protein